MQFPISVKLLEEEKKYVFLLQNNSIFLKGNLKSIKLRQKNVEK